ncbi:MAG: ASPIC/UnbV domain-containing protein, partial [Planctomycetota bacterium]
SSDPTLVLGLGDAKQLESLRITWPSGERFEASSLAAEYIYEITESAGLRKIGVIKPRK